MSNAYVYIFRGAQQGIAYVGRGGKTERPEQGVTGSHNDGLRRLIDSGHFSLEVAGPYDERTAAAVEAALISALAVPATPHLVNEVPGNGPKFAPLGVPVELADRLTMPPLSLADLGRRTGGVLLVRLASGGAFKSDELRAKFDPADPDDQVIGENIRRWWWLRTLFGEWQQSGAWPTVIAGLAGPPRRRYIAGALEIVPNGSWTTSGPGYEAPVVGGNVDVHGLRGRLVTGALFSQIRTGLFIWVDGSGVVRYQPPRVDRPGADGSV